MNEVVIDTNVVSFFIKNDSRAASYIPLLHGKTGSVSFMTIAELYRWAIVRNWGPPRLNQLRERLRSYIVVPYDDQTAWQWAQVMSIKGRPVAVDDAWIAAAALRHQVPLVTHNPQHFSFIPNLKLITTMP